MVLQSAAIATAFETSCLVELKALKPGNVHVYAAGHGMDTGQFERAAEAAAPALAAPGASLGDRIERAVSASLAVAGCNTNLGIILLCAPLAMASERGGAPLRVSLDHVLEQTTIEDARAVYRAIAAANPGGLGSAAQADVTVGPPSLTLVQAMGLARDRDRIAAAYADDFKEIFGFALPALTAARLSAVCPDRAVTGLHMALLAEFPDSHIVRKFGLKVAEAVQDEAHELRASFLPAIDDEGFARLLAFDRRLKERGLNPGTTADVVVATLFAEALLKPAPRRKRAAKTGKPAD